MKKTFNLSHPKIKYARVVDSVRSEIKRYIKRERRKELGEGEFWDFDCRFGADEEHATAIGVSAISKAINAAEAEHLNSFYVEILARKRNCSYSKVDKVAHDAESDA